MRTVALAGLLVMGLAGTGHGQPPAVGPLNVNESGGALHGYDAVAYFTAGQAVSGSAQFEHMWGGARWRFSSAANRDAFAASPDTYAPQFGGYCAWAVSRNYTADIDPAAFSVVNGKLYVNYSTLVQARWRLDRDGNIAKGHANWPALREQAIRNRTSSAPQTRKGDR